MTKKLLILACICGASAVIIGAFGAHILKKVLTESDIQIFETGVRYHFYHTFALLATAILARYLNKRLMNITGWLFFAGIVLFSGSLYSLALADAFELSSLKSILGPLTPVGGLLFIGGWLVMLIAAVNYKGSSGSSQRPRKSSRSSAGQSA